MDLFTHAQTRANPEPTTSLIREFFRFHRENPQVYTLFDRFTRQVIARGHNHFGVASIIERIRWETGIVTTGDIFKINNNHRAYYARLWMRMNPEHRGFFRTRLVSGSIGGEA